MTKPYFAAALAMASLAIIFSACGVVTDYVKDNQLRIGFFGGPDFISPVKLKLGVAPFLDDVNLGTPEAGPNLARLMSQEFSKSSNLLVVSPEDVAAAVRAKGWTSPLTPEQAVELCSELNLNVLIDGAISQVGQYTIRKGWRRLIRYFTSQQQYAEAMLTVTAYDGSSGIVLSTRASESEVRVGASESDPFSATPDKPTQQTIEESLDLAIEDAYYRTIDGLAAMPFKAKIIADGDGQVIINYGTEVGLRVGQTLAVLSYPDDITNHNDITYRLPGPPQARLTVSSVSNGRASLAVEDGAVNLGDYAQTWNR